MANRTLISGNGWVYQVVLIMAFLLAGCNRCRDGCDHGICQKRDCICDTYWEGDACDQNLFSDYTGTYSGNNSCVLSGEIQFYELKRTSKDDGMDFDGIVLSFTTDTRFLVPEQTYRGQKIQGEGQMQVERFSLTYELVDSINSGSCLIEARRD